MNFILNVLGLIALLIVPAVKAYTSSVVVENVIINSLTSYTFTFGFSDSTPRSVILSFPSSSDLSSGSLAVFMNNNAASIASSSYSIDHSLKKISINTQTPVSNALIFKVTNVVNPPSAQQFSFTTSVSPTDTLNGIIPYVNYERGNLLSCVWKFYNFTGTTNSTVDIDVVLGNRLLSGTTPIEIRFPNPFEDSDSKYLTLSSTPTITYSIDNGATFLSPLSSPSSTSSSTKISFSISLSSGLAASSKIKIRIAGIVNPPTQNPTGKNFNISTFDSNNRGIDKITQCTIDPVNVLQLTGTFDLTTLSVNDNYATPKITINSLIPFSIFQNDILQFDHNEALSITSSTQLEISMTRGSAFFVSFYIDSSQPITSVTRYFKGNMDNTNEASATTQIQFKFNIKAPYSQKPWDFVIWLKRPTGAYVKIKATLQAYAIPVDPSKVSIQAASTQMATQSQYTLNVELERAISKNGKILIGFHSDYDIKSGSCVGYNGLTQITSSPACDLLVKNGFKWLVYKIGETSSATLDAGTKLTIQYTASSTKNPLYPNTYTYRLQVYYTQIDDSLVQKAEIFGSITMTKHYSLKASLANNDFIVYQSATVSISYVNDVYIPNNSILEFFLPTAVTSFDFTGKIIINSVDVTNATLDKNFAGGKTGQITIKQNIDSGTVWSIPLVVKMPAICGDYPSITFKVFKSSVTYEEVNSGLQIRVKYPSTDLSTVIQPKTSSLVDATTDYLIRIKSRVPLPTKFYVIVTLPTEVKLNSASSCLSNKGTCSSILNPSLNVLNLTIINSPYLSSDVSQEFDFTVNQFINPRFEGSTSNWKVQLKGIYNDIISDINQATTLSSNYIRSTGAVCELDQTNNYYKGNTEPVVIKCTFVNNLIQGDFMEITITSGAYKLNPLSTFSCTSPVLSYISCINSYTSSTTMIIKVSILTSFISNRNQLTLQISGLISNSDTTYQTPSVPLYTKRFDINSRPIDEGVFSYDINCNEDSSIKSKTCKTCASSNCTTCYSSMYLSNLGSCVRDCPVQTQFRALNNPNSLICQPCTSPCYTCQNTSTTCLTCVNSSYFLYRSSHTCQTTCDTSSLNWINTVEIAGQRICDLCLAQCKICSNNSLTGCLECQTGYVLESGACRSSCLDPRSYIRNGVCVVCNAACDTCNGSGANNCLQCKELYYMNNGYCVSSCPSNKYTLPNGTCGCQSNCATCTSASPTFCSSCINSSMLLYNGSCLSSCPTYTFMSSTNCIECPKNCIQCGNSVSCLKCGPGYFIYESTCYGDCNSISYQYDSINNTCVLCPSGCDRCSGDVCTSCLDGYVKSGDQCVKECVLTNTCSIKSPVPDTVTPVPATIAFVVWVGIVFVAKWFNQKIYAPYSVVFLTSAIQYALILGTTIYSGSLVSTGVKRLLETDTSMRPIVMYLLIIAIVVNYVMNIIFAVIFYKYLAPLVTAPRQIDYITIGVVFAIGMLTNYRFCLIYFSKMFPKPRIQVEFSSRLTPIHYLCIASLFLSGFSLGAAGIILKNEYPLTDIFMLGVDILIIEVILILFSVWMVAVDKEKKYYENDIKKYHLQENYQTHENVFDDKDEKNITKNHLHIRDQFNDHQGGQGLDETNQKRLLGGTTVANITNLNIGESDNEKPLERRQNRFDLEKIRNSNKVENSFDTDISQLAKFGKSKKVKNDLNTEGLRSKERQNVIDYDKVGNPKAVYDSSKKFETSDEENLPKTIEIQQPTNNILAQIHEPSSDEIPNLPITNSIFHERSSSQFGQKVKPKKVLNRGQQRSQIIKNKSTLKKGKELDFSQTESKSNMMKKKNKFFESELDSQIPQRDNGGFEEVDIQKIIKNKIVVIESKQPKDDKLNMSEANNISSIEKREDEDSQFNEEVSPSWFNIQNQRFDISSVHSDFSEN